MFLIELSYSITTIRLLLHAVPHLNPWNPTSDIKTTELVNLNTDNLYISCQKTGWYTRELWGISEVVNICFYMMAKLCDIFNRSYTETEAVPKSWCRHRTKTGSSCVSIDSRKSFSIYTPSSTRNAFPQCSSHNKPTQGKVTSNEYHLSICGISTAVKTEIKWQVCFYKYPTITSTIKHMCMYTTLTADDVLPVSTGAISRKTLGQSTWWNPLGHVTDQPVQCECHKWLVDKRRWRRW